jgi:hypothetical protein
MDNGGDPLNVQFRGMNKSFRSIFRDGSENSIFVFDNS